MKNKIHFSHIIILIVIFVFTFSMNTHAEQVNGIVFSDNYEDEGVPMSLKGVGRKWVFFIKVFAAGFYLGEGVPVEDALEDVPKRIEVSYYHPIPGRKLSHYTVKMMKKNMTKEEFESVSQDVNMMSEYFVDLKPGDHYSLTYLPEVGTKFAYNGNVVGVIEGENFARGLFAVWVGERPMDRNIKNQILGVASDSSAPDETEVALNN